LLNTKQSFWSVKQVQVKQHKSLNFCLKQDMQTKANQLLVPNQEELLLCQWLKESVN